MTTARLLGPEGYGTYQIDWSSSPPHMERVDKAADVLLIPGFVDLHIHGAFGIDFMSASAHDLRVLAEKLELQGYEGFLPTTVSASAEAVSRALAELPEHPAILGFHLEGPFISPKHPGAQPPDAILDPPLPEAYDLGAEGRAEARISPPPAPEEEGLGVEVSPRSGERQLAAGKDWDPVLKDPRLRIVTLAPERPFALELISRLRNQGVVVSLGHSDALYHEAKAAFEYGASHVTHTFNAMRPFHHREPGILGYALAGKGLMCELIYDRKHVSKEAADLLIRCIGPHHLLAVSDSSLATGLAANMKLEMWGWQCVTGQKEVRLENGTLAGSAITLLDAFRNLAEDFGEELAIRACCINPRRALNLTAAPRVFLELDRNYEIVGRRVLG